MLCRLLRWLFLPSDEMRAYIRAVIEGFNL
jgi:hypothetical protein